MESISRNVVRHPLTPADASARESLRLMLAPHKGELRGVAARAAFDAIMLRTPAADGIEYISETIGGVPGVWCRPAVATSRTVLYLHGGWFVWGSADAFRNFVGHIAARAGAAVFIAGYRLAPEQPTRTIAVIWHRHRYHSHAAERFLAGLRELAGEFQALEN